ncbi:Transcriptional regulator, LuxR family protein [Sesbania bispinosa]|nr:Transcriptional regulator, LuxR family protein [Sesbania bispinosa]
MKIRRNLMEEKMKKRHHGVVTVAWSNNRLPTTSSAAAQLDPWSVVTTTGVQRLLLHALKTCKESEKGEGASEKRDWRETREEGLR